MTKIKLAAYWASACGGCDVSLLDLHEKIVDLAAVADIVFWPIATDFKYADVEAMPDGYIDVTLFNGAVRNTENEHLAHLLRRKSKTLVAFGSCAHLGGVPGLGNLFNREQIFNAVYRDSPSLEATSVLPQTVTQVPEGELVLPEFYNTVRKLDQVVDVDYYVPGCPPNPNRIWEVVGAIATGKLPARGSVVGASEMTLCDECTRKKSEKKIASFKRLATAQPDPEVCLLEQGFVCMGVATRAGCEHRCQKSNTGCRGCYGPPPGVYDQGLKALCAISSVLDADTEAKAAELVGELPDPVRYFNRFSIPASPMVRRSL